MKNYVKKRIRSLYITCLLWSLTITSFHNYLVKAYLISDDYYTTKEMLIQIIKGVLFSGGGELSGTIWFLRTMFFSSMMYMVIDYIGQLFTANAKRVRWSICIVVLLIGWLAEFLNLSGKQYFNIFTVVFLYELGRGFKEHRTSIIHPGAGKERTAVLLGRIIISVLILCILDKWGSVALNQNIITNPIFFSIASVVGWILFIALSEIISHQKQLSKLFVFMGRHTLAIMLFHFLCFKMVTYIQICVYDWDIEKLSMFPCLIVENGWWILYVVFGVTLPLIIAGTYEFLKEKCLNQSEHSLI